MNNRVYLISREVTFQENKGWSGAALVLKKAMEAAIQRLMTEEETIRIVQLKPTSSLARDGHDEKVVGYRQCSWAALQQLKKVVYIHRMEEQTRDHDKLLSKAFNTASVIVCQLMLRSGKEEMRYHLLHDIIYACTYMHQGFVVALLPSSHSSCLQCGVMSSER